MPNAVIIEQSAIISPLGNLDETITDLIDGESAIVGGPCFDIPVAYAPFSDVRWRSLSFCAAKLLSCIDFSSLETEKMVFIYAAAKGDIASLEHAGQAGTPDYLPDLNSQARHICALTGRRFARVLSVSNACASGALAVEMAHELLIDQKYPQALIFGFDALSRFVVSGFHSLNALSPTGARPFDAARNGLTPGECGAVALLSFRQPFSGDIVVAGAGSSNDANHRTGPSRTGEGLYRAAAAALANAGMKPQDVGAVKCHGTATAYNDAMEAKALALLFGDTCPPCASVKGALGHTSGGGALLELLIAAECLRRHTLPPTAGYEYHGVEESVPISGHHRPIAKPAILALSAGFGGVNAAVVLKEQV
jgi:3-oxoacyl-[acyl-carrier-protein] synthase-1